jgi:hypothetical protein
VERDHRGHAATKTGTQVVQQLVELSQGGDRGTGAGLPV